MPTEFYDDGNGCRPTIKITDNGNMSTYQKLCYVLQKLNEIIEIVNQFEIDLNNKEDSLNITNNRKLSETGDFTGTWFGDTKTEIDALILNGQNSYLNLINLINSNPELNLSIIDGGFLASLTAPTVQDLGLISDTVTDEIDCGFFVYPCNC